MAQDDNHKEVHAPLARKQILTYRVGDDISISRFLLISLVIRPLALNWTMCGCHEDLNLR